MAALAHAPGVLDLYLWTASALLPTHWGGRLFWLRMVCRLLYTSAWSTCNATPCIFVAGGFSRAAIRADDGLRALPHPNAPVLPRAGKDEAAEFVLAADLLPELHSKFPRIDHRGG